MRERFVSKLVCMSQWPNWLRHQYGELEICGSNPSYDTNFSQKLSSKQKWKGGQSGTYLRQMIGIVGSAGECRKTQGLNEKNIIVKLSNQKKKNCSCAVEQLSLTILLQTKNSVFVQKLHYYIFFVSSLRLTRLTYGSDDANRLSQVSAALSPLPFLFGSYLSRFSLLCYTKCVCLSKFQLTTLYMLWVLRYADIQHQCGLFAIHAPLGQTTLHGGMFICIFLLKANEVTVTVCLIVLQCKCVVCGMMMMMKNYQSCNFNFGNYFVTTRIQEYL